MYASETESDISRLIIFERKILQKIYGPIKEGEIWRIRNNKELYQVYKSPDIFRAIKISRLILAHHIKKMNDAGILIRIVECKPERKRRLGRPKLGWMNGIMDDIRTLAVRN